ncbi:molecular chaperone DjiA [Paracoccus sp. S-4012]|uniref:TerB family tellurite resistance protein n=1 Tax=Paracoccus sp. S-4012 TaxID=2665648 RepID=UPI0012AF2ED8|nr:TerB family tellurite resistance protein [Paracoccus sp. S-4012]MRX51254.1 molecular chaperone DjiA [Paracoccus sp. S-4012]
MLDAPATPTAIPRLPRQRGFWRRIGDRLAAFMSAQRPAPPERSVAFTIAVIALGAKLAKVDGEVQRSEVAAFRRIFVIPRAEEKNAARVFDLARSTPVGFDAWAARIAAMFPAGDPVLGDVLEGLCVIAVADGGLHESERAFLHEVGRIFALPASEVAATLARHDPSGCEPCAILGVSPATPLPEARARWRELVREAHPDRAIARGLPPEAVRLAEARTRRLNAAWDQFRERFAESATTERSSAAGG